MASILLRVLVVTCVAFGSEVNEEQCPVPFPLTDEGRLTYSDCLHKRCQDGDSSATGHFWCGLGLLLPTGCNTSFSIFMPEMLPHWTVADFCPCVCGIASCVKGCAISAKNKFFLHPQVELGPLGDLSDTERREVANTDPGVAAADNPNRIGAYARDWWKVIQNESAKREAPTRFTVYLDPREWEPFADTKILDYNPILVYGQPVVRTSKGLAPEQMAKLQGSFWSLSDNPRRFALLLVDLQRSYEPFVRFTLAANVPLLNEFRRQGLPVFWTNFIRRPDDGLYGAVDRFYGPRGILSQDNPLFDYGKDAAMPLEQLMPTEDDVKLGRVIKSIHMNKFADVDSNGKSILGERLKALGVDTLVVTGAWTDDCILATVFYAGDSMNFDTVVVTDGVASSLTTHFKALEVMGANVANPRTSTELLTYLREHRGDAKYILAPLTLDHKGTIGLSFISPAVPSSTIILTTILSTATFALGLALGRVDGRLFVCRRTHRHVPLLDTSSAPSRQ